MDVRLPNGAIIKNVPADMTRTQLMEKLRAKGYDVSSFEQPKEPEVTGEVGFLEKGGPLYRAGMAARRGLASASRLGVSPEEVVAGLGEAVENLPEAAVGMGARGYALAELAASPLTEGTFERYGQAAKSVGQSLAALPGEAYEAVTSPVETIIGATRAAVKDPLAAAATVSGLTGLGALLPKGLAATVGGMQIGGPELAAISRATNPLAMPGALARGAAGVGREFVSPVFTQAGAEQAAGKTLLGSVVGEPTNVMAAMRAAPPSLLGDVTAAERLAAAGQFEPVLGTLQGDLTTGLTEGGRAALTARQRRLAGIQQQIAAIDEELRTQGRAMSPEAQAQLSAVRNDLMRARAAELQAAEAAQAAVSAQVPATGQLAPGQAIGARAREIRDAFREERISPLYQEAFKSAGNVTIPVRNVIGTAEDILGARLADVPLGVASRTIRDLRELERGATLKQLDRVRKSINKDIAAAQSSGMNLHDLHRLHDAIDEAVEASRIPTRAKLEYAEALNVYRNEFVPRFRTGIASDILRTTKKNQSGVLPSQTVNKFLANEDTASQFAATFGNDAIALQAMETGVQDAARLSMIDPTTKFINVKELDKFIADKARQFEIIGIDPNRVFGPVRAEAARLQQGYADLSKEMAFTKDVRTASELVDKLLADPAAMDTTRRRLSDAGREALTKEVVDRAIRMLDAKDPAGVLDYLKNSVIRMVVDQPYVDRLRDLAENQKALMEIEKRAPKADLSTYTVDLANVPRELLLDLKLLATEIARVEDAEGMMGLRPADQLSVIGAERLEAAKKAASGFLNRKMTIMEKILDSMKTYANRKTAAVLTDVLTKNPEKGADLIERALLEKTKPPRSSETKRQTLTRAGTMGALAGQNVLAPENRNAMAR